MTQRQARLAVCWAGIAAIIGLAVVPAVQTAYWYATTIARAYHWQILLSPAFWAWAALTVLAVFTPATLTLRMLPYLQLDEGKAAYVSKVMSIYATAGLLLTLLWQWLAWGCFPMEKEYVRFLPFYPWPERPFMYGYWTGSGHSGIVIPR